MREKLGRKKPNNVTRIKGGKNGLGRKTARRKKVKIK